MTVITTQLASINISFDRGKKTAICVVHRSIRIMNINFYLKCLYLYQRLNLKETLEKLKIERKQVIILETVEPISNKINVTIKVMLFFRIFNFFCYRHTDLKFHN